MGMEIEWKYQATPEILEEIANSPESLRFST